VTTYVEIRHISVLVADDATQACTTRRDGRRERETRRPSGLLTGVDEGHAPAPRARRPLHCRKLPGRSRAKTRHRVSAVVENVVPDKLTRYPKQRTQSRNTVEAKPRTHAENRGASDFHHRLAVERSSSRRRALCRRRGVIEQRRYTGVSHTARGNPAPWQTLDGLESRNRCWWLVDRSGSRCCSNPASAGTQHIGEPPLRTPFIGNNERHGDRRPEQAAQMTTAERHRRSRSSSSRDTLPGHFSRRIECFR